MKFKINNKFSAFIILIIAANSLYSQEKVSLKQLLNQAFEQNYQIKIFKNEELKLTNSNTLGYAGFYPVLSLDGTKSLSNTNTKQTMYNGDVRESNNATSNVSNASLNMNWNFFDGFKMFATKSKLNYLERIGKENTRFFVEQTAFDIAIAYYQLINEINKLDFLTQSMEFSKTRLDLVKTKIKIGNSDNLEFQNAKFDYNSDSIAIIQQKLNINQLILQINKIINKSSDYDFFPAEKINLSNNINLDFILNQSITNNISLNLEKIKQLIANQDVEILKSNLYPDLTAYATYSFQDQTNTVSIYRSNRSYGLNYGLRFSFNLFNGEQDAINIQNSKIDAENTELQIMEKEKEIKNLVAKSYNNYKSLLEVYDLQLQNSQLTGNSVSIAQKQFELGTINSLDFRQIQLNYYNANLKKFETEYLLKIQELELLRLGGILLNTLMQ